MTSVPVDDVPRFRSLFAIALGVRALLVVIGLVLATLPPAVPPRADGISDRLHDRLVSGPGRVIEPWYRWDAVWYAAIAENGYTATENHSGQRGVAFQPGLPLCMAAAAAIGIDPFWAALVLVNVAAAAGFATFARVACAPDPGWRRGDADVCASPGLPHQFLLLRPV